jgi:S1-C subfamily serine protease
MRKGTCQAIVGLTCLAALLAGLCLPASAQDRKKEKKLYLRLLRSSTWVVVLKPSKPGSVSFSEGSGWLVNAQRKLVVTNYHVVGKNQNVQIFFPYYSNGQALTARKPYINLIAQGQGYPGKVIAVDRERDLAVVQLARMPTWGTTLPIAAHASSQGERVYNLGNPGGDDSLWQFSASKVLRIARLRIVSKGDEDLKVNARFLETDDVKTRKGQSGSAVVNERGELVGVVQSITPKNPQTTMCIDRDEVLDFLNSHKIKASIAADKKAPAGKAK